MASGTPRRRASTLKAPEADVTDLKTQMAILSQAFSDGEEKNYKQYVEKINAGQRIRRSLHDDGDSKYLKDAFRHVNGFHSILSAFNGLLGQENNSGQEAFEQPALFPDLIQTLFGVLSAALRDHKGNQRYFQHRLNGNGWVFLEGQLLELLSVCQRSASLNFLSVSDRIFGCLISCALDDDASTSLFSSMRRKISSDRDSSSDNVTQEQVKETVPTESDEDHPADVARTEGWIHSFLKDAFDPTATLTQPNAILVALRVWAESQNQASFTGTESFLATSFRVLSVVNHIASLSSRNLNTLREAGALRVLLPCLINGRHTGSSVSRQILTLCEGLLSLGVASLQEACNLYAHARTFPLIADLVLKSLEASRTPPFVHFDLSLHGYASIELPGISSQFPPQGPKAGYTLSMWLQISRFDMQSHTTIFGAFDATQTCFVLVYIEKDTRNLILQTSVTSSRPSVRFKSVVFREAQWYHVVITHHRPKTTASSRASLFVNGEFAEQVKSQYPASLTSSKTLSMSGAEPAQRRVGAIQAFFGTPQDLATQLGKNLVTTQWRLASSHLFADVLSDDLIAVYYHLGPRYSGNFQDCLGSFQTYEASAALNIRNESLHPGKEDRSDIISAIRSKAGALLSESAIILGISATAVLGYDDTNNMNESVLTRSLSKSAGRNLWSVTRGGRNALAINSANPSINEALLHSSGFAILTGDPYTLVPGSLDEAVWCVAGCAPAGLALLEAAQKPEDIIRSLKIILQSVRNNWRNSESMERDNGFGALAVLLASKLENREPSFSALSRVGPTSPLVLKHRDAKLDQQALAVILEFIGFREDNPEESVINNPLAYRILLVETDLWRDSSAAVQRIYYDQFVSFVSRSKFHHFNLKRLLRMRLLKKWLETLKSEVFTEETFDFFLNAFRTIFERGINAEAMRSLSLFITYAIHKPTLREANLGRVKSLKSRTSLPTRRRTFPNASSNLQIEAEEVPKEMTHLQVAIRLLEMYTDILCQKTEASHVHKFARTVTNKWLLHLLADGEGPVVVLTAKILARLLIVSGPAYVTKFIEKTGGLVLMKHRLKRWWHLPSMWTICLAIFFGVDVATIDFSRPFDLINLLEIFCVKDRVTVVYPQMLPLLTGMLARGLATLVPHHAAHGRFKPTVRKEPKTGEEHSSDSKSSENTKMPTLSMEVLLEEVRSFTDQQETAASSVLLHTVMRFLSDIHSRSQAFRDFAATSPFIQELFSLLLPAVVRAAPIGASEELGARDLAFSLSGREYLVQPLSVKLSKPRVNVERVQTEDPRGIKSTRQQVSRRMSSYVMVSSEESTGESLHSGDDYATLASNGHLIQNADIQIVQEVLEMTMLIFIDQIFSRKDFPGLGLFLRVPPALHEPQACFETYILRNTISHLRNHIKLNQNLLWEPRVLTNLARFASHLAEAVYEGWFVEGAEDAVDFLADILEYVQLPQISTIKTIRLCNHIIVNLRTVLLRIVLLRLSELGQIPESRPTTSFLEKIAYWQLVLQPSDEVQSDYFHLLCFLLYSELSNRDYGVRMAAVNLWRMLLVQKPDEMSMILERAETPESGSLVRGFRKIMELDNETFLAWAEEHKRELEDNLFHKLSKSWSAFVAAENQKTIDTAKARVAKRKEKLKTWENDSVREDDIVQRNEVGTEHWQSNIFGAEDLKRQRALQDQIDTQMFSSSTWMKMKQLLQRPCGLLEEGRPMKWQLDLTEGRNRMRIRLILDRKEYLHKYRPKRRQSQGPFRSRRSTGGREKESSTNLSSFQESKSQGLQAANQAAGDRLEASPSPGPSRDDLEDEVREDDFEIIEGPQDEPEYEDKNRKVMRSLQRGDQVEHVHNVARIVGLEAVESLLILGKSHLYLLDNLFQRSDGEVVNSWQAPQEERDTYLQLISGRQADPRASNSGRQDYETRYWQWEDVLSISKRRFLFRDVALELFFVDGRSYLLIASHPTLRDELYQKLLSKTSNTNDRLSPAHEDGWRIELLRNPSDEAQNLGSKFTNVFASAASNPVTRKWIKGEISNFHYLMLINTMAGRTFNDLTQYPVFPWVIADYTSDELDLTDPRSFRDLSKPMGCQTPERQAEFRDRYRSFAEMGDQNAKPFHYGTHYSSAMIVTSYLIRLQPFVQSYLLLQGGSFDHPDRLFYSIEKAWISASRDNMSDVRELIPEFFFLPDFLTNINDYDFGTRQGSGGRVDSVVLPPWARGDPKIFIAKNREALESDYVSQHLHSWIDLVFGHKQRGENALEATNVFHYLSYHGARDLDNIEDPVERLATIGIIHNFGQTPFQVFQKAHPPQEEQKVKVKKLDSAVENLTRLPFPILETNDRISSLQYSVKHDRLLCSNAFRLDIGPSFDKYMQWGFIDNGVRFYASDTRKLLGLFENVHQKQITCALFADSKTLITSGSDCTITVWTVIDGSKAVDLQPRTTLFGHRDSVNVLAVSRSFSALLSASIDGCVILWDLNRLDLVRVLTSGDHLSCARINDTTGTVMLCRGPEISVWTLNGDLVLKQDIFVEGEDQVFCCAWYEGSGNEQLERNLIFTGQRKGVANVWNVAIRRGAFVLEHVKSLQHLDQAGYNTGAPIVAVLPMAHTVYTGDDDGRVYEWDCIQRQ